MIATWNYTPEVACLHNVLNNKIHIKAASLYLLSMYLITG